MYTVRIIESRQLQARSLLYTPLFYSYYVSPHTVRVLYVSPLLGLTIEFDLTNYTVHEGGVAMLRIVKIGETDYPMSVNLSTVDGSAVGKFIDIIGGEGKLISLGGTVMPETYVTVHEQIGHNAQKCENMQLHNFGTTMSSELVLGMTVIEG